MGTNRSPLTAAMLAGDLKTAVIDLLYRLADDSLLIGHRNSEWTGLGPILEEDIAFASMAQDKMGHAVAYYSLLHDLGEPEPDELAFARDQSRFRCCSLVVLDNFADEPPVAGPDLRNNPVRNRLVRQGDWAKSLARQFLFTEADAVRIAALVDSRYEPLAHLARKIRGENKYHHMHGRLWMNRLASAADEHRPRIQAAVEGLFGHALGIFEPTRWDGLLAAEGVQPTEAELGRRWRAEIESILEQSGLECPAGVEPVFGGRAGHHPPEAGELIEAMQKVARLDPTAKW